MLKKLLQTLVVKTTFWPFSYFYKVYYNVALQFIIYVLKKQKEIIAIYLTAGMATGDYVYGLSDIDLIVIIKDGKKNKRKIDKAYRKLGYSIPILKYEERGIFTIEEIFSGYRENMFLKYKLNECRKSGRLLYGREILNELRELNKEEMKESILGQAVFIWATLIGNFFKNKKDLKDMIMKNYLCYKLSADSCKVFILTKSNKEIFDRQEALKWVEHYFDGDCRTYIERMQTLPKKGFRINNSHVLPDTYNFCLHLLNKIMKHVIDLDKFEAERKINNQIHFDFKSLDFILSDENKQKINSFVDLTNRECKDYIQSILISPFSLVGIDEENICLFIIQKNHIPFEIIKKFNSIIGLNQYPQRLYLYIITPDMAISLDRTDFRQPHTVIFSLYMMPLIFLLLGSSSSVIYGGPLDRNIENRKVFINRFLQIFSELIHQDERKIQNFINNPNIVRISNVKFHLLFWQALQLKLIENSAILGKIFIPLSSAQVYRYWNDLQLFKLHWLKEFHDEYKKDLNGISSNSEAYFPEAVMALKRIYGAQSGKIEYEYCK